MNENNTQSDHDALINVVRDVKNIKEGQDIFHSDQANIDSIQATIDSVTPQITALPARPEPIIDPIQPVDLATSTPAIK